MKTAAKSHGGPMRLLRRPGFRGLLIGQAVSGLGDWVGTVAMMSLVLEISGSSTAVAGVLVLRLAPAIIAGPLATRLVREWNRRHVMLAMDAARVVIAILIPLVYALWWVYTFAFLLEAGGLIFLPARDAAIPEIAGEEELEVANGLVLGSSYGTMPLGAALFALASSLLGGHSRAVIWTVFAIDAATFAVSFTMIRGIREIGSGAFERSKSRRRHTRFLDAWHLREVRTVAPAVAIVSLGLGSLFSLGIVFVRKVLGASNTEFSLLIAFFGVGAALGLLLERTVLGHGLRVARLAVLAQGLTVVGMSLSPVIAWALVGAVCFGAATTIAITAAMSELQERLDDQARVIAFSVFHVVVRAGLAVAAIGAGLASDLLRTVHWPVVGHVAPSRVVLIASGAIVIAGSLASRGLRDLPAERQRR